LALASVDNQDVYTHIYNQNVDTYKYIYTHLNIHISPGLPRGVGKGRGRYLRVNNNDVVEHNASRGRQKLEAHGADRVHVVRVLILKIIHVYIQTQVCVCIYINFFRVVGFRV